MYPVYHLRDGSLSSRHSQLNFPFVYHSTLKLTALAMQHVLRLAISHAQNRFESEAHLQMILQSFRVGILIDIVRLCACNRIYNAFFSFTVLGDHLR